MNILKMERSLKDNEISIDKISVKFSGDNRVVGGEVINVQLLCSDKTKKQFHMEFFLTREFFEDYGESVTSTIITNKIVRFHKELISR